MQNQNPVNENQDPATASSESERQLTSLLRQFDIGAGRNFGFIAGPGGYIITENDFCHSVYRRGEQAELNNAAPFAPPTYVALAQIDIEEIARPIPSYHKWAHYWGIKDRIAVNYAEFLRSMHEIGLPIHDMPKFGEEPVTNTAASAGTT